MNAQATLTAIAAALVAVSAARAAIIHVPGDYPTIQAGIDAAVAGDEVVVANGTWTGEGNKNLDFAGKAITVRSASGDPLLCIIDCEQDGRAFYFHSGETSDARVEGLTIQNGSREGAAGGMNCASGSSPTVAGCRFIENHAYGPTGTAHGGAVFCGGGSPAFIDCHFADNAAYGGIGGEGGAIYSYGSDLQLTGCTFMGNWAGGGPLAGHATGQGGGVYQEGGSAMVADCTFTGNLAFAAEGDIIRCRGGAFYTLDGAASFVNCVFLANEAESMEWGYGYGGAIHAANPCEVDVVNCTLAGNLATWDGGGVHTFSGSVTIANSILWDNIPNSLGGSVLATVTFSDVEGGYPGQGNLDADPMFIDPLADLHLLPGSPCINTGANDAPGLPDHDIDGEARLQHCRVDMGADETSHFLDCNGNGVADACDIADLVSEDCDENGVPDECEPDCNGNGIADACDIMSGASMDCNLNGVPDECDIASGASGDCNENEIPDDCEVITLVHQYSGELSPLEGSTPQYYTLVDPPEALDDVLLSFSLRAGMFGWDWVRVYINTTFLGEVYTDQWMSCPALPEQDQLTVPMTVFNDAIAGGNIATVTMLPSPDVGGSCPEPSFISVTITYPGRGDNDQNGNGIPDNCECEADVNGDQTVDVLDLLAILAAWGPCAACPEDVNGDGAVDVLDLLEILAAWGPCATNGACCFYDVGVGYWCEDLDMFLCMLAGGYEWAEGEECATYTCPSLPDGACCFYPSADCLDLIEPECLAQGGAWEGPGTSCATTVCPAPPLGACCFYPSGDCQDLDEYQCADAGGIWEGPNTACATTVCSVPQGDVIGNAIVISWLPASTAGDTNGYNDDYDEACPYGGSISNDVVYRYTPAVGRPIDITLCTDSQYDTKLYIYEDQYTPGAPFACSDDACTTPAGQPGVSELMDLHLQAGRTYFIVIDGANGENGYYTLDID